jgi:hypothetical protein
MGCLARLGCLIMLAILAVVGWFTRSMWLPERFRTSAPMAEATWQPVSTKGAERARAAMTKLSKSRGPVYQTVSAGDVASLALSEAAVNTNGVADSLAAKIVGDRMYMQANANMSQLKGKLGPLGGMLQDREHVELSGSFLVVKPGMGAFVVKSARVGEVTIPEGMIPRVVDQVVRTQRPAGLPANALPLPLPGYIGDIRIANGRVNLYKNTQ